MNIVTWSDVTVQHLSFLFLFFPALHSLIFLSLNYPCTFISFPFLPLPLPRLIFLLLFFLLFLLLTIPSFNFLWLIFLLPFLFHFLHVFLFLCFLISFTSHSPLFSSHPSLFVQADSLYSCCVSYINTPLCVNSRQDIRD